MAQPMRKLLFAAAGGLLASLMIGTISAAAEEYDIQDSILHLNSFIVTDSGNRVLTGSCEADQITESGWYLTMTAFIITTATAAVHRTKPH